jgi:Flp pilus assembly protein TadD
MIPATKEEQKKEAFRLFEDGRYNESLQLCSKILESEKDQAVGVLLATNLFYTGKLEDAEVCFRDLLEKMPESSYVHSYLAKVLEARGDDAAIAEYAAAVHLDPTNQEALRSYAEYLLSRSDYRGALPVLRRLVSLGKREEDAKNLVRALIGIGEPQEALAAHRTLVGEQVQSHEYLDALFHAAEYRKAAEAALEAYRHSRDTSLLKKYLAALARYDTPASLDAYAEHIKNTDDCDILADYILLLAASGEHRKALETCTLLAGRTDAPKYRLLSCDLKAAYGNPETARAGYEQLIRDELKSKNDLEMLARIIGRYRKLLEKTYPINEALARFLDLVSNDINIASLLETARFYEETGNPGDARSWYYRAYRADYLTGGLEYARFLAGTGDIRECEMVMIYILNNVRRSSDLHRVAAVVVDHSRPMHHMRRLMERLIERLDERRMSLNTDGLELLAIAFAIAARHALLDSDYAACKQFCLRGIDVLPVPAKSVRFEEFLALIHECKEHAIADRPVIDLPVVTTKTRQLPVIQKIKDELELDEQEQKIVEFLRSHKKATELELRKVLGTRRVVGVINRLIQKAGAKNRMIVEKKGVGEDGEVYEYAGN